jgi:hypothetical protein
MAVDNSFPHIDWPWRNTEGDFITAGELPLWNPYASLGLSFGPQYENQLFLPLEWIDIFVRPVVSVFVAVTCAGGIEIPSDSAC